MIASNKGLARRLNELEKKYDGQFRVVFEAIRELMTELESKPRRIGFKTWREQSSPFPILAEEIDTMSDMTCGL